MMSAPTIVWFQQDLRLADHPALEAALEEGSGIIPVWIWCPEEEEPWAPGGASRWWLHHSLARLNAALEERGSRLLFFKGNSAELLLQLAEESGAETVLFNQRTEPAMARRNERVASQLAERGLGVRSFNGSLLFDPGSVLNKQGTPFKVFTPFWRHCQTLEIRQESKRIPARIPAPSSWPGSLGLRELDLLPKPDWAQGLRETWVPGEDAAHRRLEEFMDESLASYAEGRDLPDQAFTSFLGPALHFGEISPWRIWHRVTDHAAMHRGTGQGAEAFLRQLVWREFAHHLLHHFPHTDLAPLRENFAAFPWEKDAKGLQAWQRGKTGYPIVDAGMRQLWETGWMHNRVRMIAGSFLVKDLLIPWQEGARWFWDTLVDADLANNSLGWQWVAGSGADAAPYFRIFNPITQGEKFDPAGRYIRRYLPELAKLPDAWIHKPWKAPESVLREAGISLGTDYPNPIVDHAEARLRALECYDVVRIGS